ncbi:16S rRNA (guanine(966)-N(2))-methyltransferase RsmD [Candidatus Poribacteria bacterium]|nr:MAG: 16S rRNA (guanine(966)-N(2))-methyltransferase RsmD [Candidatus Poribacteria bacterium]
MRIIAGKYKGRRLTSPKGMNVRPTSDRVKESVFSIIQKHIVDANFLDLCSGTGNIGIEALSRGAKQVTFLDRNPVSLKLLRQNLKICGIELYDTQVKVIAKDLYKGIKTLQNQLETFELIYFDPPYDADIYNQCLTQISDTKLLNEAGILLIEHHKKTILPTEIGLLTHEEQRQYGDTCVSLFRSIE